MTELEQAEQDYAAARAAERIAEWKAMEAKAAYYRYASEAMTATAEVMGADLRRKNAMAAEFVEKAAAIAALEAPSQPLPSVEGVTVTPATEENSGGPIIDAQTCEPIDPHVSWEPPPQTEVEPDPIVDAGGYAPVTDDDIWEEPAEHISVLTGDPAVEPESGLHGEPVSVLDDPELQAAVGRAQATLVDAELDAELDRVREQERARAKHHFSIFGKLEDA